MISTFFTEMRKTYNLSKDQETMHFSLVNISSDSVLEEESS